MISIGSKVKSKKSGSRGKKIGVLGEGLKIFGLVFLIKYPAIPALGGRFRRGYLSMRPGKNRHSGPLAGYIGVIYGKIKQ